VVINRRYEQDYISPESHRMSECRSDGPRGIVTTFNQDTQHLLGVVIVWCRVKNNSLIHLNIPASMCTLLGQQMAVASEIMLPRTVPAELVSLNYLAQLLPIERWINADELDDFQRSVDGRHVQIEKATSFEVVRHDDQLLRPQWSVCA
jgi:hypothetical protein